MINIDTTIKDILTAEMRQNYYFSFALFDVIVYCTYTRHITEQLNRPTSYSSADSSVP